jgi:hypothetical protein
MNNADETIRILFVEDAEADVERRSASDAGIAAVEDPVAVVRVGSNEFVVIFASLSQPFNAAKPQFDIRDGLTCGVEALLRWKTARRPSPAAAALALLRRNRGQRTAHRLLAQCEMPEANHAL